MESILRNSSALTIFSILEGKMKYLGESIESEINPSININDLKANDGMDQYLKYLTKVFGMTQDKSSPSLELIKRYKIVRNAIAHQNGKIKANDMNRVKTLPHI